MKKCMFLILSLMFFVGFSNAQSKKPIEERARLQADNLTKQLSLSSEQNTKLYEIILAKNKQTDKVVEQYMGNLTQEQQTAKNKALKEIREKYDAEFKSILTPQQYEKWNTEKNNRKKTVNKAPDQNKSASSTPNQKLK